VLFPTYCIGVNQKITKNRKLDVNKLNKDKSRYGPNSIFVYNVKYYNKKNKIDNN
jgi:hypothetical protein